MSRASLFFSSLVVPLVLVVACGGKSVDVGDAGSGGSGGGGGSGGAGDGTCDPLPGCTSRSTCMQDCNTCTCHHGAWTCTELGCPADAGAGCPPTPPTPQTGCSGEGTTCHYGGRCGETCTCSKYWTCSVPPCPPPECPPSPPTGSCDAINFMCTYGAPNSCNYVQCTCQSSGEWLCVATACVDAGRTD